MVVDRFQLGWDEIATAEDRAVCVEKGLSTDCRNYETSGAHSGYRHAVLVHVVRNLGQCFVDKE